MFHSAVRQLSIYKLYSWNEDMIDFILDNIKPHHSNSHARASAMLDADHLRATL